MARILLGVSGGIAAYKACEVCRLFVKGGHEVVPLVTPGAERFVTAETFRALARRPAGDDIYLHLTRADLLVVAPCTANTLAKLAHGLADNVLTEAALAHRGPVLVAPAMNPRMWSHPATRANAEALRARGVAFVGPDEGETAEGELGVGRMVEPDEIVRAAEELLAGNSKLKGKRVLVSAGGTREPIDTVRFVGNRSSGRMGIALAAEARRRGARVTLLGAQACAVPPPPEVELVQTADRRRPRAGGARARHGRRRRRDGRGRRRLPPGARSRREATQGRGQRGRSEGSSRPPTCSRPSARRNVPASCSSASQPTKAIAASSAHGRSSTGRTPISSSTTTSGARTSASTPPRNAVTLIIARRRARRPVAEGAAGRDRRGDPRRSREAAQLNAVVMAAGEGTRMRPLTERWPKPVLPIDGRPVIATLLRELAAAGCTPVGVVTGHLAEQVEELVGDGSAFGLKIRTVRQPGVLGSGDAVQRALAAGIEPPCLVLAADTVFTAGDVGVFSDAFARSGAAGAMSGRRDPPAEFPHRAALKIVDGLVVKPIDDDPANRLGSAPLWALGPGSVRSSTPSPARRSSSAPPSRTPLRPGCGSPDSRSGKRGT